MAEKSMREVVRRTQEAEHAMRNGDAEPFKAVWTRRDDVSAFPGYGSRARMGKGDIAMGVDGANRASTTSGRDRHHPPAHHDRHA